MESLQEHRGCTLLVVTHDQALARRASLRLALDRGGIVESSRSATGEPMP
jgi:predicted ABC-type transport system involved in lysophospholipase L1 biosynthesis ATPase subunit